MQFEYMKLPKATTLVNFGTGSLWDWLLSGIVTFGIVGCIAESVVQLKY